MPFVAGAMLAGSALSFVGSRSEAKKMRREMAAQRRLQEKKLKFAKEQWAHYTETYGDLEKLMVADAITGVQGDFDGVTSRASADMESQYENQVDRNRRNMMRFGLDPSSGRFQSSDRQAGLDLATNKALAMNNARESERRYADQATWQRRATIGQHGSQLISNSGDKVMGSIQSMANMHGNNANMHAGLSSNLFSQGATMGMYGAMGVADHFGGSPGSRFGVSGGYDLGSSGFESAAHDAATSAVGPDYGLDFELGASPSPVSVNTPNSSFALAQY